MQLAYLPEQRLLRRICGRRRGQEVRVIKAFGRGFIYREGAPKNTVRRNQDPEQTSARASPLPLSSRRYLHVQKRPEKQPDALRDVLPWNGAVFRAEKA